MTDSVYKGITTPLGKRTVLMEAMKKLGDTRPEPTFGQRSRGANLSVKEARALMDHLDALTAIVDDVNDFISSARRLLKWDEWT